MILPLLLVLESDTKSLKRAHANRKVTLLKQMYVDSDENIRVTDFHVLEKVAFSGLPLSTGSQYPSSSRFKPALSNTCRKVILLKKVHL